MPFVASVSKSPQHNFSKESFSEIHLIANHGVDGDAHAGVKVQHLYRMRKDPSAPNLCQVHLLHQELFAELQSAGIQVSPGQMGENILTTGIDLLALSTGTRLTLGETAMIQITGLREPCSQLNALHPGLMKACISRDAQGSKVRKAGVMAIVLTSGTVRPGDPILLHLPTGPFQAMGPV